MANYIELFSHAEIIVNMVDLVCYKYNQVNETYYHRLIGEFSGAQWGQMYKETWMRWYAWHTACTEL